MDLGVIVPGDAVELGGILARLLDELSPPSVLVEEADGLLPEGLVLLGLEAESEGELLSEPIHPLRLDLPEQLLG